MPNVNFNLNLINSLSFQGDPIQIVKQDPSTLLLGVGFSNGIISLVNNKNDIFSKSIHSLPILSLDWLVNGKICVSVDDDKIIIYDPLKDNISFIKKKSNVKGIRSISPYEILGWYRDGSTEIIDIRGNGREGVVMGGRRVGGGRVGIRMGDKRIDNINKNNINLHIPPSFITSANINKINNNLIYTTSVPGTSLNIWDKRYTSRGEFFCTTKPILNSHTLDFEFINGSIIFLDNLSKIYKVSETGEYVRECDVKGRGDGEGSELGNGKGEGSNNRENNNRENNNRENNNRENNNRENNNRENNNRGNNIRDNNLSNNPISFNPFFNSLFISNPNGLYSFSKNFNKLLKGPFLGSTGVKESLFVYTRNEIKEYKIKPYLSP